MNCDQATAHFQLLNTANSYLSEIRFVNCYFLRVPKFLNRYNFFYGSIEYGTELQASEASTCTWKNPGKRVVVTLVKANFITFGMLR